MKTIDPIVQRRWECTECTVTAVTNLPRSRPATPHHTCKGLFGLLVPMVPENFKGRLLTHEREDYIGEDIVQVDGAGRPIMNVSVERPDGSNDLVVYAPVAIAGGAGNNAGNNIKE